MTNHAADLPHRVTGDIPISVLLVDDQRFIGIAVARLLAGERDLQLHCCERATAAIAQANHLSPRVIFQDLLMPDIDGLTLVGLFRANPQTATTPIVVLSGHDDPASRDKALAAGADDYMVKLPNKATLVACIRRHASQADSDCDGGSSLPLHVAVPVGADVTFDRSMISDLRDAAGPDGAALVATMIHEFLEEAAELVDVIARAVPTGDVVVLKQSSHKLSGSAMMFGARRLGRIASRLEKCADRADLETDAAMVSRLAEELDRLRVECLLETQVV